MMGLHCPKCQRELFFSGDPPSFCGYCREPLPHGQAASSVDEPKSTIVVSRLNPSPRAEKQPETIGDYELGPMLGAGGMGAVYEAVHVHSGRRVAIKLLSQRLSDDSQHLERFRQEGRLTSQINHPRCVFVYAADEDRGRPYIVMELMPGTTLEDQIKGQGRPLSAREAIERILEIIDGLQAAHRLGVLHRDVKPSNCFLLEDGSVKVGDFGLSKLLEHESGFTEPGAYKGTVAFSPVEQLRNEPLDFRADVYSVAATLFYLLTGRAPFEGQSWVSTVARAASEPAPDVRDCNPEVPRSLARIVRRGLHPDRNQRYQNLDQLRYALRNLIPTRTDAAGVGLRIGAFLIDQVVLAIRLLFPLKLVVRDEDLAEALAYGIWIASTILYYAILEGIWGFSIGKLMLRLRVYDVGGYEPPGWQRAALRSLILMMAFAVPRFVVAFMPSDWPRDRIQIFGTAAGLLAVAWPMRPRSGFRGMHEIASRTRVVQLPWPEPPLTYVSRRPAPIETSLDTTAPTRLGPFIIRSILGRTPKHTVFAAEDSVLERSVLILLHESGPAFETRRHELARPTRLRWLSAGIWNERAWDAFIAPGGAPIRDLVEPGEPMPWANARPILEQLTTELVEASGDGSLPSDLSIDHIWVRPDGRVQLLDRPLNGDGEKIDATPIQLIRSTAILLLEGRPGESAEAVRPIRAAVPEHVSPMLNRLMGVGDRAVDLPEFAAWLETTRGRPRAVNFAQKAAYLGLLAALHSVGIGFMFSMNYILQFARDADQRTFGRYLDFVESIQTEGPQTQLFTVGALLSTPVLFWPVAWAVWAFFFRGGFGLRMAGLRLVRRDGRPALRIQCAFRVLVVWAPVVGLLLLAHYLGAKLGASGDLSNTLWWCAVGLLAAYVYFSLLYPTRSIHDALAGTILVPE